MKGCGIRRAEGIFSWSEEKEEGQADHIRKALVLGISSESGSDSKDPMNDSDWDWIDSVWRWIFLGVTR